MGSLGILKSYALRQSRQGCMIGFTIGVRPGPEFIRRIERKEVDMRMWYLQSLDVYTDT